MAFGAQGFSHPRGMLQLDAVALVVIDGQRQDAPALRTGDGGNRGGIQSTRQQHDRKLVHAEIPNTRLQN